MFYAFLWASCLIFITLARGKYFNFITHVGTKKKGGEVGETEKSTVNILFIFYFLENYFFLGIFKMMIIFLVNLTRQLNYILLPHG